MRPVLCTCGMPVDPGEGVCPKCGTPTTAARRGRWDADVAHHGQTVAMAVAQADQALARARSLLAAELHLVVGRGERVPPAVLARCQRWVADGVALRYAPDRWNPGVVVVTLR